jgi:hypothetical protein
VPRRCPKAPRAIGHCLGGVGARENGWGSSTRDKWTVTIAAARAVDGPWRARREAEISAAAGTRCRASASDADTSATRESPP